LSRKRSSCRRITAFVGGDTANIAKEVISRYPAVAVDPHPKATLAVNPCPVNGNKENQVWNSIVHIVVSKGWVPVRSKHVMNLNYEETLIKLIDCDARSTASLKAGFFDVTRTMTLIIATKITWWLTNHHVGQVPNELSSYVGKVAHSMSFTGSVSNIRTVLWVAGKWTSTVSTLKALGIPDIRDTGDDECRKSIKIKASSDMELRINGSPAGTASTVTYHAIGEKAGKMHLGALLPVPAEWPDILRSVNDIKQHPANFDAVGRRDAV
jgi:hypothetical protein